MQTQPEPPEVATGEDPETQTDTDQTEGEAEEAEAEEGESTITLSQKELDDRIRREVKKTAAITERKTRQRLMAEFQSMQAAQVPEPPPPPKRENFRDEESYLDAKLEYRDALKAREEAVKSEQQYVLTMRKKAEDLLDEAEDFPEFDREVFLATPFTDAMNEFVIDSDKGAKILAYFGSNPDEQERIAKINSPVRQIAEMAEIEKKMVAKPKNDARPVESVKGGNVSQPNLNSMSQAEYEAYRRKNGTPLWARRIYG